MSTNSFELTAAQKLAVNDHLKSQVQFWAAIFGAANFLALLSGFCYVYFVLPNVAYANAQVFIESRIKQQIDDFKSQTDSIQRQLSEFNYQFGKTAERYSNAEVDMNKIKDSLSKSSTVLADIEKGTTQSSNKLKEVESKSSVDTTSLKRIEDTINSMKALISNLRTDKVLQASAFIDKFEGSNDSKMFAIKLETLQQELKTKVSTNMPYQIWCGPVGTSSYYLNMVNTDPLNMNSPTLQISDLPVFNINGSSDWTFVPTFPDSQ